MGKVVLEMENIIKDFPGVRALNNVDFKIYSNEVMALLGENGAGKSTLMKILTGVYQKTSGSIKLGGNLVEFKNTKDSQKAGISIIHQELNLVEEMTIGENIFLGREPSTIFGKINWKKVYDESSKLLERLGIDKDPRMKVKELSIGQKQMVEIAKALSLNAEIIIMDEPTDALTTKEIKFLFKVINKLRDEGKSIVYISHKLDEIFDIADKVTILRDGHFIDQRSIEKLDKDKMIELMVGRALDQQFPDLKNTASKDVLEVKSLTNKYIDDISFKVKQGEILGIAGLMGAGRTELAKSIYGAYENESGKVIIDGKEVSTENTWDGINNKIAYVSEDRKLDGLILGMTVEENMHISSYDNITGFLGKIDFKKSKKLADEYVNDLSIKTPSINQKVNNLSGGNQQKVAIAKSLLTHPKVLILDEPTRGVDVGAKREIYDLIKKYKNKQTAIIIVSSEIPELLGMCDNILVMHEGKIQDKLSRKEATQEKIMALAVGEDK